MPTYPPPKTYALILEGEAQIFDNWSDCKDVLDDHESTFIPYKSFTDDDTREAWIKLKCGNSTKKKKKRKDPKLSASNIVFEISRTYLEIAKLHENYVNDEKWHRKASLAYQKLGGLFIKGKIKDIIIEHPETPVNTDADNSWMK